MLFKLIMEYLDIFTDINTWVWKPYFVSKVMWFMHIKKYFGALNLVSWKPKWNPNSHNNTDIF